MTPKQSLFVYTLAFEKENQKEEGEEAEEEVKDEDLSDEETERERWWVSEPREEKPEMSSRKTGWMKRERQEGRGGRGGKRWALAG